MIHASFRGVASLFAQKGSWYSIAGPIDNRNHVSPGNFELYVIVLRGKPNFFNCCEFKAVFVVRKLGDMGSKQTSWDIEVQFSLHFCRAQIVDQFCLNAFIFMTGGGAKAVKPPPPNHTLMQSPLTWRPQYSVKPITMPAHLKTRQTKRWLPHCRILYTGGSYDLSNLVL